MNKFFMINKGIIREICEYASLNDNDVVLEIGAGNGNLTEEILKTAKNVIAIEMDKNLVKILQNRFYKNINNQLKIIEGDALKVDFSNLSFNKIISNLPYSISRKIILKILTKKFDLAILTVQKEFAEKLIANKGKNYRAISVLVQSSCDVKILKFVSKEAFYPIPNVDSAIIRLTQKFPLSCSYINFVKNLFSKRNKIIYKQKRVFELSPDEIFNLWNLNVNY